MVGGRLPSVEDYHWWNTTFIWRWPSVGRRPSVEDDLRWKMIFGERQSLMEDNFQWKTTFSGRWPSAENDLPWKMTFGGGGPLVAIFLWGIWKFAPHLTMIYIWTADFLFFCKEPPILDFIIIMTFFQLLPLSKYAK